jgi:hypothetical protein
MTSGRYLGVCYLRLIFKICAAPVVLLLNVTAAIYTFVLTVAGALLVIACVILLLTAAASFIMRDNTGGWLCVVAAFLVSPFGLPAFAAWLLRLLVNLNDSLKDYLLS